jgi:hypothetical protein
VDLVIFNRNEDNEQVSNLKQSTASTKNQDMAGKITQNEPLNNITDSQNRENTVSFQNEHSESFSSAKDGSPEVEKSDNIKQNSGKPPLI